MAKKVTIICGKCKKDYPPDSPYLIPHLTTYKNPDDTNSYYKACKKCLCGNITNWYDYENIYKLFETINVPFIEKLWHEGVSITNARLLQSNNNISAAIPSTAYDDDVDDKLLLIFTLIDEYFKRAKQKNNNNLFFNTGFADSIQYTEQERHAAEKVVNDSIQAMEQQQKQAKKEKIALLDDELKAQLLDDFGYFKVDLLSDNDYIYLSKKWGLRYNNYELVKLEEYWIKTFQSFEITTSTHQDLLLKIAKISLEIDNSIEKNEWDKVKDLSKLMNDLMGSAQFTPKSKATVTNRNFVSSISELVAYIEDQSGFIPKFNYRVPKDLIDATIQNLNKYTQNLVLGEVNLENVVETALTKMELDQSKEEDEEASDGDDNIDDVEELIYGDNEDDYYTNDDLGSFMEALKKQGDE